MRPVSSLKAPGSKLESARFQARKRPVSNCKRLVLSTLRPTKKKTGLSSVLLSRSNLYCYASAAARKNLTDFDRYKVMVARVKRSALIKKALK
jgi:hypothetical protein